MDLVGWTNDRLVVDRIARLPQTEWVYGVPNASIVMAAFLHVAPGDSMAPISVRGTQPTISGLRLWKSVTICGARRSLAMQLR
jgi:hypothetical protein